MTILFLDECGFTGEDLYNIDQPKLRKKNYDSSDLNDYSYVNPYLPIVNKSETYPVTT